jgi:hypothetical protein
VYDRRLIRCRRAVLTRRNGRRNLSVVCRVRVESIHPGKRKIMNIRTAGAVGLSLTLLASLAHAAERRYDKTFKVTPGGKLTVEADGSDIIVSGTDSSQVTVEIIVKGSHRRVENMLLSAEQNGDDVTVMAKDDSGGWLDWIRIGVHDESSIVKVQVPTRYSVDLKTSGGDLKIAQLQGEARAKTSGGDVDANDVHGNITLNSSGGDIHVARVEGETHVETSGGDVRLLDVTGAIKADTSSGEVVAKNVRGNVELLSSGGNIRGEKIDGAINAKTSGGDIDVELVGANRGINATSSGGDVTVRMSKEINGAVDVATSGGSVSSDLPVTSTRVSESKLNGTVNGGGESIRVRTSGGDIKLRARD